MNRTQSLLLERLAAVAELRQERDPIARQLLRFRIDEIDRELRDGKWRPSDKDEVRQ